MSVGFEGHITEIIMKFVNQALATYKAGPSENWRAKDAAICLFTSIASLGSTAGQGVTSTNVLLDVISFFSENVYSDLVTEDNSIHPILQVNAIRFIYTFRYQVSTALLLQLYSDIRSWVTVNEGAALNSAACTNSPPLLK